MVPASALPQPFTQSSPEARASKKNPKPGGGRRRGSFHPRGTCAEGPSAVTSTLKKTLRNHKLLQMLATASASISEHDK